MVAIARIEPVERHAPRLIGHVGIRWLVGYVEVPYENEFHLIKPLDGSHPVYTDGLEVCWFCRGVAVETPERSLHKPGDLGKIPVTFGHSGFYRALRGECPSELFTIHFIPITLLV